MKTGYYALHEANAKGCLQCFCYGITGECRAAELGVEVISHYQLYFCCSFPSFLLIFFCLGNRARRGMVEHGPAREDPRGAVLVDHDERRHRGRGRHAGGARLLLGGAAAGAVLPGDN